MNEVAEADEAPTPTTRAATAEAARRRIEAFMVPLLRASGIVVIPMTSL